MSLPPITIKPFGAHSVLIEWPNEVNEKILETIIHFETFLKANSTLKDHWEMVPAYNSLLITNRFETIAFEELSGTLNAWYKDLKDAPLKKRYLWRLPVSYDVEFGIDLEEISNKINIPIKKIIELHTKPTYTVFGIGFLPGFMYLGGLEKELEVVRKSSPRALVKKGSVGIAGKQTGIYPQDSPGGWNIIGNCSFPIFDSTKEEPCFVSIGDKIQFYEISKAEYNLHKIEAEVGIYKPEKQEIHD